MTKEVAGHTKFISANPRFDFSFDYPSSWEVREVAGLDGDEVFITGPSSKETRYTASISVVVRPSREANDQQVTLEEAVKQFVASRKRSGNYKETSRSYGSIAGAESVEVGYTYTSPPAIDAPSKEIAVIERRIFVKRKGYLYEFIYGASKEDYTSSLEHFENVVRTFQFRSETLEGDIGVY